MEMKPKTDTWISFDRTLEMKSLSHIMCVVGLCAACKAVDSETRVAASCVQTTSTSSFNILHMQVSFTDFYIAGLVLD